MNNSQRVQHHAAGNIEIEIEDLPDSYPSAGGLPSQLAVAWLCWQRTLDQQQKRYAGITAIILLALLAFIVIIPGMHSPTAPLVAVEPSSRCGTQVILALTWSPDKTRIASANQDGTVQIWDAGMESCLFTYHGNAGQLTAVAWSPNGRYIAAGGHTVQVWNTVSDKLASTGNSTSPLINRLPLDTSTTLVQTLAWSPDSTRLAVGSASGKVEVWSISHGTLLTTYHGQHLAVTALAWSPDGKYLASGSVDHTVQVWNASSGGRLLTYRGHTNAITAVAYAPDGAFIASASKDNTVQVWNAGTGQRLYTYYGHTEQVTAVAWSPDGRRIASASYDVQVWDALSGKHVFFSRDYTYSPIIAMIWTHHGTQVVALDADYTMQSWQVTS